MKHLLLIPLLFIFSCTKSSLTEKDVHGEWKTTKFEVDLYEMNKTMESIIKDIALSTVYNFNKDGSWTSTANKDTRQSGEWSLNKDRGELNLTSSSFKNDQVWIYKDDFKFEYQMENSNGKEKRTISKV